MSMTENHYKECLDCGIDVDTNDKKCPECKSEDLDLIDNRLECDLCNEQFEDDDLFECERCNKKVCLDCYTNSYPINTTICNNCNSEFESIMGENNFPGY